MVGFFVVGFDVVGNSVGEGDGMDVFGAVVGNSDGLLDDGLLVVGSDVIGAFEGVEVVGLFVGLTEGSNGSHISLHSVPHTSETSNASLIGSYKVNLPDT